MAEHLQEPVDELTFADVAVRDPLTPVTRQQRLYLLAVSMIGVAIVNTGLVPSKIATFGIELNEPDRSALLFLLSLVTVYFLASFIIYAASDYAARAKELKEAEDRRQWKLRYQEVAIRLDTGEENVRRWYQTGELEERARQRTSNAQDLQDALRVLYSPKLEQQMVKQALESDPSETQFQGRTWLTAKARIAFEFFVPPIVGLYAIYALLFGAFVVPDFLASIATYSLIGLIAGSLAKLLMPGDDPGGLIITVLLGVVGALIVNFVSNRLLGGPGVTGVNLISIGLSTLGALTLLAIYRLITLGRYRESVVQRPAMSAVSSDAEPREGHGKNGENSDSR